MTATLWYLIIGTVFLMMALSASLLKRLPLTFAFIYLTIGIGIGPVGLGLLTLDPIEQAELLERLTELAVLISLFTAGLKLRTRLSDNRWHIPVRLAGVSMLLTVGLITLAGVYGLGLSLGAAVLLGAILSPTDPVLASDVQVDDPVDRDRLRFGLTGEAGLNDGSAFPFVMLGLGLLGLHELGAFGWRWLAIDVLWAVAGGLVGGWLIGTLVARLVLYLRREHREAIGLDDFLALGAIALAYGVAELTNVYGFLAVFTAGLALRHVEMQHSGEQPPPDIPARALAAQEEDIATDAERAPAYMAQAVLGFTEQLERIAEVVIVIMVGAMLIPALRDLPPAAFWFIPLLFLVVRPLAAVLGLLGSATAPLQRAMICWFGIRGIGSVYYLMFAIHNGVDSALARPLIAITLATVAVSVVVHGVSVTPLMMRYRQQAKKQRLPQATAISDN